MSCHLKFSDGELCSTYDLVTQSHLFLAILELERQERETAEMEAAVADDKVQELLNRGPVDESALEHHLDLPEVKRKPCGAMLQLAEVQLREGQLPQIESQRILAGLINSAHHLGFSSIFSELIEQMATRLAAADDVGKFLDVPQDASAEELTARRRHCGF